MNIPLGNAHLSKSGKKADPVTKVVPRGNEPISNKSTRSLADKMYPKKADKDGDGY